MQAVPQKGYDARQVGNADGAKQIAPWLVVDEEGDDCRQHAAIEDNKNWQRGYRQGDAARQAPAQR